MAPSSNQTIDCNVLLSFQGQDSHSRRGRTFVSHLRASFDRKGYTTTELESDSSRSESDPFRVDRAITGSKVAVVVISENFASSPWCLESLVKIMDFHQSGSLALLIPVFYEISPSDVRNQSGKLRQHFSSHEAENSEKVQTWRLALSQLTEIYGGQYSEIWYFLVTFVIISFSVVLLLYMIFLILNDRKGDAELIGKITDDIWDLLIGAKSVDFCGLVGMDRHMKALHGLLDLGSMDEVRWISIWGTHGMGKTELTKYLYEEISHHFDTSFRLENVRWRYGPDLGDELRRILPRNLNRNRRPKVLLVLDEPPYWPECRDLEEKFISYDPGSRVIIITTEKYTIPVNHDGPARHWYEVVGLETSEALQLFCFHAFQQTHPSFGFEDLSSRAVKLTGGCPATILKLGSGLFGRDRIEWEAILSDYESSSVEGIIDSNKINFSKHNSVASRVSSQSSTMGYFDGLVGMDGRMQGLSQLLELESHKEVCVVGIWGTGGIGKTTLARYAYKGISQKFHTTVFLENYEDHHSSCLEKRFLSAAMKREAFAVRNAKDGLDVIKSGLRHNKVLLIVDGVENNKALEDVQKMAGSFQPGSRIIVTTRDESLLLANGVKRAYEVKNLRFDEALQLFYHFALKQEPPSDHFNKLAVRAIKLVGFHPLALKVTASMFFPKDMDFCETILQKLSERRIS